jgi:hypothetical protein
MADFYCVKLISKPYMHIDVTVYCGTIEVDGKKIIEEGNVFV